MRSKRRSSSAGQSPPRSWRTSLAAGTLLPRLLQHGPREVAAPQLATTFRKTDGQVARPGANIQHGHAGFRRRPTPRRCSAPARSRRTGTCLGPPRPGRRSRPSDRSRSMGRQAADGMRAAGEARRSTCSQRHDQLVRPGLAEEDAIVLPRGRCRSCRRCTRTSGRRSGRDSW